MGERISRAEIARRAKVISREAEAQREQAAYEDAVREGYGDPAPTSGAAERRYSPRVEARNALYSHLSRAGVPLADILRLLAALEEAVRCAALEEAATIAESYQGGWAPTRIAEDIRALAAPEVGR